MTTNERDKELKEIMNIGFKTKDNYSSNKMGTIQWIVDKPTLTTGLLIAKAAQDIRKTLMIELEAGFFIKELGDETYRTFKIIEDDQVTTLIEIEVIEWTDLNESCIRIHYWEANAIEMDESLQMMADMIYEAIAQQLEM